MRQLLTKITTNKSKDVLPLTTEKIWSLNLNAWSPLSPQQPKILKMLRLKTDGSGVCYLWQIKFFHNKSNSKKLNKKNTNNTKECFNYTSRSPTTKAMLIVFQRLSCNQQFTPRNVNNYWKMLSKLRESIDCTWQEG